MWGADYPHTEGSYPYSREALRAAFAGATEQETRRMLSGTAAQAYGFDVDYLRHLFLPVLTHRTICTAPSAPQEEIAPGTQCGMRGRETILQCGARELMEETGITKYEAEIFYGLVAPAKTPPQAIKSLSDMLLAAMNTPEMKTKFEQQGLFPDGTCGAKFGTFLQNITADYEKITTAAGIKPN